MYDVLDERFDAAAEMVHGLDGIEASGMYLRIRWSWSDVYRYMPFSIDRVHAGLLAAREQPGGRADHHADCPVRSAWRGGARGGGRALRAGRRCRIGVRQTDPARVRRPAPGLEHLDWHRPVDQARGLPTHHR